MPATTANGRRGRIYYGTQAGVKPPTFVLFCNDTKLFPEDYKKFIERQFRWVEKRWFLFSTFPFRGWFRWGGAGRRDSVVEGSASCSVWARRPRSAAAVGCCTCGREVSGWGGLNRHMLPLLTAAGRMSASRARRCASSGAASRAGWS